MSDFLSDGIASIQATRKATMTEAVTYTFADASTVSVQATRGRSEFEMVDQNGIQHELSTRDFLLHAADLKQSDTVVTPTAGETITDASGNVYEVMQITGVPSWQYSDPGETILRIHTKVVA
jgi:hypothetical protein